MDVQNAPPVVPAPSPELTWQDRMYAVRDRWFRDPSFQSWIATFPLTRRKARQEARAAFDICAGFVYSQVVTACVELELFEALSERPRTNEELAVRAKVPVHAMATLMAAAASLRLVIPRRHGRWGLGAKGAAIVGSPGLTDMIRHNRLLYADLQDPVALLRGEVRATALSRYWPYAGARDPASLKVEDVADYSALMASSQGMISTDILDAVPLGRHRHLMDVGGGQGAFISVAAARYAHLKLSVFDLPAVAERARDHLARVGLSDRVVVHGGSFFTDPLPRGADVISLVRIVHDHDDEAALRLLRAVRAALPADGMLMLAEPMSATPGAETMGDAYFGFYLMAMGSGRPRSAEMLVNMVREAGFREPRLIPTARPIMTRVLVAQP